MNRLTTFEKFKLALSRLESYLAEPIVNDRDRSGIIHGFSLTFELAWKSIAKAATEEGLSGGGPRTSLAHALTLDLMEAEEEEAWLAMLDDRNLATHVYSEEMAAEVASRIPHYLPLLRDLEKALENRLAPGG
jgi:nucleotidyltransferase substrate binding protein (TIGR01987 family)